MPKYEVLSKEISDKIENAKATGIYEHVAFEDQNVVRRKNVEKDKPSVWRPVFVHDIDKIMHCPFYNRYTDKTQVFSLYKNDDITRRSLHVQLVSRISRTIGSALHLNLDLIEAIALGHDIGHPPFAHSGEKYLDEIYFNHTGRRFVHNVHSVRVLDGIFPYNISLQTLDGILCHNGEFEMSVYEPSNLKTFEEFDEIVEHCYNDRSFADKLMPSTLEGAVVRISDIIAYLGKDRQDAMRTKIATEDAYTHNEIGSINAEIINNLVVNIIENSYGKNYIMLDDKHFYALKEAKRENYSIIYNNAASISKLGSTVKPMMSELYDCLIDHLNKGLYDSPIYRQHINYINKIHYKRDIPYEDQDPNEIVVDYIASMTDDYLIELHHYLFPQSPLKVDYIGYFDNDNNK